MKKIIIITILSVLSFITVSAHKVSETPKNPAANIFSNYFENRR